MQLSIHSANLFSAYQVLGTVIGAGDLLPALRELRRHTCKKIKLNSVDTVIVTNVCTHYGRGQKRRQVLKDHSVCFALGRLGNRKNATEP